MARLMAALLLAVLSGAAVAETADAPRVFFHVENQRLGALLKSLGSAYDVEVVLADGEWAGVPMTLRVRGETFHGAVR